MIADDMGLGKTVQALAIASIYRQKWPLVVVCPSSVRFTWKEAVVRWIPSLPESDISVITSSKDPLKGGGGKVVILSYDLLPRREKELEEIGVQVAILDESHFVKNGKSNRSRAAAKVFKRTSHLVLLSGTPALSRPIELFSQVHLLQPGLFQYATPFGMRYCDGKQMVVNGAVINDFKGSSHMAELKVILEETYVNQILIYCLS